MCLENTNDEQLSIKNKENMKKIVIILLLGAGLVFSVESCKKKKDPKKTENTIKINGESFYVNDIFTIEGTFDSKKNKGNGNIEFSSISEDKKERKKLLIGFEYEQKDKITGNYSYPQKNGDLLLKKENTYYHILRVSDSDYSSKLKTGSLSIKHNSDKNYTIHMDLNTEGGDKIIGDFSDNFELNLK